MRRPSLDRVMDWWWVVAVAIIAVNFALALWNAYLGNWYMVALPFAAVVGLTFQQGYYLGRRKGYERFREMLTPSVAQCVGGPMDGIQLPKPPSSMSGYATVEGFPEGRYEFHDEKLLWVEDD